jgi:hypothetical protein
MFVGCVPVTFWSRIPSWVPQFKQSRAGTGRFLSGTGLIIAGAHAERGRKGR